jgi:formate-dependent nitrite reductase membrane component NrfD
MANQTSRQWIVTHEWMVKPMQQTEWIEGQGILIWLAEVFSALGMGLYLVSLVVGNWWGCVAGYLIIMGLKMPLHFVYLGRPFRFWRALPPFTKAWRTSWMARGFFFCTAFAVFGLIQIITMYMIQHNMGGGLVFAIDWIASVIAGVLMLLTGIYCGFMMSFCKSVPFWNTGLLPIVFVIMGIADGLALIMAIGLLAGEPVEFFHKMEIASRWGLIVNAVLIGTYLINASYQSVTAELSVKQLVVGRVATAFWVGVVILGISIPLIISIASIWAGELSPPLLVLAILCHTVGAFALKYCVLKVGIYRPILSKAPVF